MRGERLAMISYDSLSGKLKIALSDTMTPAKLAKTIVDAIIAEAQPVSNEKWLAKRVDQCCEIESQEAGKVITQVQRRSQIVRVLDVGNPNSRNFNLTNDVCGHDPRSIHYAQRNQTTYS